MKHKSTRKGFSVLETSIAVIVSIVIIFVTLAMFARVPNTTNDLIGQSSLVAVDSILNDIKNDYFNSVEHTITNKTVTFVSNSSINTYLFDKSEGKLYKNGVVELLCKDFNIEINNRSLVVSIKTEGGKLMDLSVFK